MLPDGRRNFYLDTNNQKGHELRIFDWGDASDEVILGDWDGDGDLNVGLARVLPDGRRNFYLDTNNQKGHELASSIGAMLLTR